MKIKILRLNYSAKIKVEASLEWFAKCLFQKLHIN